MADSTPAVSVLFVCLGNHCRSPAARAVAESMLANRTFARFDSAGTSRSHVGQPPHPMSVAEGAHRGFRMNQRGRQIHPDDFAFFDLVVAMDRHNVDDLARLRGGLDLRHGHYRSVEPVQVVKLRRWDPYAMPGDDDVPDPWGGSPADYRQMFDMLERCMPPFLDHLEWLHREHPGI